MYRQPRVMESAGSHKTAKVLRRGQACSLITSPLGIGCQSPLVNLANNFQIAKRWFNQTVIFVDTGKPVHDRLFLFAIPAVPESHAVSQFMSHESLKRLGTSRCEIKINPC